MQAFVHRNYVVDFAFSVYYFCITNENDDNNENRLRSVSIAEQTLFMAS